MEKARCWATAAIGSAFLLCAAGNLRGATLSGEEPWSADTFSGEREDVEKLLGLLSDGQAKSADPYLPLIGRLDSEDFDDREAATAELRNLPVLDRMALMQLQATLPPEAAMRVSRALGASTTERFDEMVATALEAIIDGEMKGLAGPLFEALASTHHYKRGLMWNRMTEAARATARPEDIEILKEGLQSEAALVRAAAAEAILEVAEDRAPDLLLELVGDPDDQVKWMAARSLAFAERRECLKPLAELLMSEEFGLRWRALDTLREVTKLDFGYAAAADFDEREEPAKKWLKWVEEESADAELFKDAEGESGDELSLFNGKDLEGWIEKPDERLRLPKMRRPGLKPAAVPEGGGVLFSTWKVYNHGLLSCMGFHPGTLRTEKKWANYRLTLDYLVHDREAQSGVGLFVDAFGDRYVEVQLKPGESGDIYRFGDFELDTPDGHPVAFRREKQAESNEHPFDWNRLEVTVKSGSVEVRVNDRLQNHVLGGPAGAFGILLRDEGGSVDFRNVKLRTL